MKRRRCKLNPLLGWFLCVASVLVGCATEGTLVNSDEETDRRPHSATLDEAVDWLLHELPDDTRGKVSRLHRRSLNGLHLSLGMWIRNNVPVWGNKALIRSVSEPYGEDLHPDHVGGLILIEYWHRVRRDLPEIERIVYFESRIAEMTGRPPVGNTHLEWIKDINKQIRGSWPEDAPHQPFRVVAEPDTYFTSDYDQFGNSMQENLGVMISYNRSLAFYKVDTLTIGLFAR